MARSSDYLRDFLANLRQPGMPPRVWLGKVIRNRWRAVVTLEGCCGHPGEPGC
jgi:hypothetical protein